MDEHLDHAVLQRLEARDRLTELLARLGVFQRGGVERVHHAHGLGAQQHRGVVGRLLDDRETLAGLAQQLRRRVLEGDVCRAQVIDGAVVLDADTGALGIDQEQRDAILVGIAATAARRHDQLVGLRAMQHHGLAAVELAVAGGDAHVVQFIARLRLVEGHGQLQLAAGDLLQQRLLAAGQAQRIGTHHGGEVRLHHQAAAQFLLHHHHVERLAREAALRFRHRQRGQAQFDQRAPGALAVTSLGLDVFLARLEVVALVDEAADGVGQLLLFVAEIEVHVACLLTAPESSG
ncbi:hypothetical protein D3C81_915620 [compost metagenome]